MPFNPIIIRGQGKENSALTLVARIRQDNGDACVPADIDALTLRSFDTATADLIVPEGEDPGTYTGTDLDPATVVLPTLNSGYLADNDPDQAFNVLLKLHGSYLPEGDKTYRIELHVVPAAAGSNPFYVLWEIKTTAVFSE